MSCQECNHDELAPAAPGPNDATGGPHGPTPGARTRSFPGTWETSQSTATPVGRSNDGYIHNVVSTNGQWARGELPDLGFGYAFALRRPNFMREPRTDLGTYNFAKG